MPFEVLPAGYNVSNFIATVHEHTTPTAPATVIRTNQTWGVKVHFETSGALSNFLPGTWHIGIYLESIGPGQEIQAAFLHVPLTPGPDPVVYDIDVDVAAGLISVPNHQTRPFKLVTTVSYMWPNGDPGPMAGYLEGPIVQFYNPA